VQLGFLMQIRDTGTWDSVGPGWYIDEVTVVTGAPPVMDLVSAPAGFETDFAPEFWSRWESSQGVWEVGVPTSGPGSAHAGSNCVATVLGGNYPRSTLDTRLESPRFAVPAAGDNPRLRFWHYYNFGSSDGGVVQIRVVGSNTWDTLASYSSYSGYSWVRPSLDLSAYAGREVQLGFLMQIRDTGTWDSVGPGWYIDEVEIRSGPDVFNNPESFELSWGDWDTDNYALWQIGRPTSGPPVGANGQRAFSYTNCAATLLGGNYSANSSGRLITPSLTVPAVNPGDLVLLRFWQWYQYGTGDSGKVQISVGAGTNWFPWETLAIAAPTNGSSGSWQQFIADLTPYQGQRVRLGFLHTANSDGSVGAGWFIDEVELSGFIPNPMLLGQDVTGTFNAVGDRAYYVLNAPPGGHLMLNLTGPPGSRTELYVRRGALPSAGAYDYRVVNPGASNQLFVPDAQAGPWYVMVYVDGLPAPGPYTLRTDFHEGIFLTGLTPTRHGNSGAAVVDIQGAGFDSSAWAWLVHGGTTLAATNVSFVSASRLIADFDLTGLPADLYQLTVLQGTDSTALPFEVTQGIGPKLETKLVLPSRVGYHTLATLYVEFANTGDAAMPAPLLEVGATQNGVSGAWLTLTEHRLVEGFWTSAQPEGFAHSVQFLASGATPGLLQPGESGRVPVYYTGWKQPWDFGYPPIYFNLGILDANNTNFVDWIALKDTMRPSSLTAEQWEPVFWNLVAQTGPTWGDYVRMLNDNARYLHRLGQRVTDIRELLGFEVMQASGLSITRTLTSAVDAQVQTPGLPLTFTRSFSTDIPSHFTLGRLGRGWSDNWDRSLSRAADGTVTILGPGGSRRVFKPDSRTAGRYFAPAGDASVLTPIGGGAYTLRESDGTIYAFRTDGKLDYVADTHNNLVTCTYNGDSLTRLTHSAGPYLDLAYSGNRLASVTDSLGRWTAFTFDGSGEHLQTATDYRGHTTTYAYDLGGLTSAATRHALTNIFNADGSESRYEYDTFGRLIKKAGCCGSPECTYFSYDSAGRITATDALTNSTKYYFDHRGLLVRTENPLGGIVHRTFDIDGRLVRVTDAAGRSRTFTYDPRGNLSSETDALGYPTRYTYTADFNRLASVLDAKGNLTRYAYHADGALASITYPDGSRENWTCDNQGNRVSWTNRRGQMIEYVNDSLGRLLERRYPDGVVHTFDYDTQGNLTSYTDPLGITTQEFDADGRLAKITYPGDRWLGYTYDAAGRRALMTNELGYETRYFYDSAGRLERLTDESGSNIVVYAYDAAGRMALKTLGNGVYTTYTYDPAGQLLDLFNHKPDDSVLSRFQYTYDSRGRRDTMTTTYGDGDPRTDLAGLWRYGYDDTSQLIGWTAPWGRRVDYTYDALGNRLSVRDDGTNTVYTVNNLNQYTQVGSTTYQYDADGNLTNKVAPEGTTSYGWSFENKLIRCAGLTGECYTSYDARGNIVHRSQHGTAVAAIFDPVAMENVIAEFDGAGGLIAYYRHGLGLVGQWSDVATAKFATFDAVGTLSESIGEAGTYSDRLVHSPFGRTEFGALAAGFRFGFVGNAGVALEANGLLSMRARFFDPEIGRFISPDPTGLTGLDLNLYRYAKNLPNSYIDPEGAAAMTAEQWDNWWTNGGYKSCKAYQEIEALPGNPAEEIGLPILKSVLKALAKFWIGRKVGIPIRIPPGFDSSWGAFDRLGDVDVSGCLPDPSPEPTPPNPPPCERGTACSPTPPGPPVPPTPPIDPNALTGPKGFGPENYIQASALFPYMIEFENATNALVPAQRVVLSNHLTNRLDWTTFELTEIAFGDQFIAVPPQTKRFETSVQLSVDGYQFVVEIEAGIRLDTGEVYARFQSLNPTNGLPPPVEIGMLPPEDGTGRGQGHLSYVIRPNAGLATGTEIRNVAYIVFDQNPAIGTDWVDPHDAAKGIDPEKQALVTIDADEPSSAVSLLPETAGAAAFEVCWSGTDVGAGIANYDLYVQADDGPWTLWLAGTSETCATFVGSPTRTYRFYSRARDGAGHLEAAPAQADAVTQTPVGTELEADVAPRPHGNDAVTVSDWVQVGRFAAGLDEAAVGSEFMRADCAPRFLVDVLVGGNGAITVSDWVQAGRYAAGLDPATPAMGPSALLETPPLSVSATRLAAFEKMALERAYVRFGAVESGGAEGVVLPVQVRGIGQENALGFSLTFDPARWQFERVELTGASEGAELLVNASGMGQGRVGVALALPPGSAWPTGMNTVATLHFLGQGSVALSWADRPIARELIDTEARSLEADFLPPEGEQARPALSGSVSAGILILRWSHLEAVWVVEQAKTLTAPVWTPLDAIPSRLGGVSEIRVPLSGEQGFFRIRKASGQAGRTGEP
jgi:RHS repeat-associated protein